MILNRIFWLGKTLTLAVFALIGATILGALLASGADMLIPQIIAGTVLGPGHPDTVMAWTAIGTAVMIIGWSWLR